MSNDIPFGGHQVRVFYDWRDGDWIAEVLEFPNASISAFGDTPEDALRELREAYLGVLESFRILGWDIPSPKAA